MVGLCLAGEIQEVFNDLFAEPGVVIDNIQVCLRLLIGSAFFAQQFCVSQYQAQGIVDLMGHACGQLPDRGEFVGVPYPLLHLLSFRLRIFSGSPSYD